MFNAPGATAGNARRAPAENYLQFYTQRPDPLPLSPEGIFLRYGPLASPTAILRHVSNADTGRTPLVFLALVEREEEFRIVVVHRSSAFKSGIAPSPYDGKTYAFLGDIGVNHHIEMAELQDQHFELADEVLVRTVTETSAAAAAAHGTELTTLPPPPPDVDTEMVEVRYLQPVPHRYIPVVLGRADHTPLTLWGELAGTILSEGAEDSMRPLIQWLQAAVSRTPGEEAGDPSGPPANSLGEETLAFPLWRSDALHLQRAGVLDTDFPHWNRPEASNADLLTEAVRAMHYSQEQERAQRVAERAGGNAPKLPSQTYPSTYKLFLRVAGVEDERDLPQLYHVLANTHKSDRRSAMQFQVSEYLRSGASRAWTTVLVTKELYETVSKADLGAAGKLDDLTHGLQPFTCGFGRGPVRDRVEARIAAYDTAMGSETNPTLAEQVQHLTTKEVVFPSDALQFVDMVQQTSTVVAVVQGHTHPHTRALMEFAEIDAPNLVRAWSDMREEDQQQQGNIFPYLLREIQLLMVGYYDELLHGGNPDVPTYRRLKELVFQRRFHLLPSLPQAYVASTPAPAPAPIGRNTQGGGGNTGGGSGGNVRLGERIQNSQPTKRAWMTKYEASGKGFNELRALVPKDESNNPVCLSYHLKGFCYTNCQRSSSHVVLTGATKTRFESFVNTHLSGQGTGAGTPAPANSRAATPANAPAPAPAPAASN